MNKNMLVSLLLIILAGGTVLAQDLGQGGERTLGGHGFLPSMYVSDPWVATTFMNATGGGQSSGLKTPFYNLDGEEIFVLEGSLFYAALGMGFQQKLGQTNAVGMRFSANARSGTDAYSVVAEGVNVDRSVHAWYKKRLLRSDKTQFSAGLDWDYAKTFLMTPQEFAQAIRDGEDLDSAQLLKDVKSWTARLTLDYAHAFSPTYGVRVNGAVGLYEEPLTSGVAKATHRLGVLLEMDMKHKYRIPLGLSLGHTQGFPSDDPTAGLSGTLFGIWYTGRQAFTVGVETGYMTLPVLDSDEEINAVYGIFTIRYYF